MVLFLANSDVERVLTMKVTLEALEILYKKLGEKQAVFFPRQDLHVPLARPEEQLAAHYLKVMGGASPAHKTVGRRLSSDVCTWPLMGGLRRRVNNIGLGAQFAAVGARVYELAKKKGVGRPFESDLFLEDIHP